MRIVVGRNASGEARRVADWTRDRFRVPQAAGKTATADDGSVLVDDRTVRYIPPEGPGFFFHPGLAVVRLKRLAAGGRDVMCEAMGLELGLRVLDCTLGMAGDAIVVSYVVGESGIVHGIESAQSVAATVAAGLKLYPEEHGLTGPGGLTAAMRRISVSWCDHLDYLSGLATGSYDVVYFDPMFRKPVDAAGSLTGLRRYANAQQLSVEALREAKRVAARRVVVKERAGSSEFARLGLAPVGRSNGRVGYGWIAGCDGS